MLRAAREVDPSSAAFPCLFPVRECVDVSAGVTPNEGREGGRRERRRESRYARAPARVSYRNACQRAFRYEQTKCQGGDVRPHCLELTQNVDQ